MMEIKIKEQDIVPEKKYTLIKGKFKQEDISIIKGNHLGETLNDFEVIPLKNFIEILFRRKKEFRMLTDCLELTSYLKHFIETSEKNIKLLDRYKNVVDQTLLKMEYIWLKKRKKALEEDLKIAEINQHSENISAKLNLLEKIKDKIKVNKKNINFIEEDYLKLKNQVDQIENRVKKMKDEIKENNQLKKDSFNNINKITRALEDGKKESLGFLDQDQSKMSEFEKIKEFQKQAKEAQYKINELRKHIKESQKKLKDIKPKYEKIKSDYLRLKSSVEKDEEKVRIINSEIEENLLETNSEIVRKINLNNKNYIRPLVELQSELNDIKNELSSIKSILQEENDNLESCLKNAVQLDLEIDDKLSFKLDLSLLKNIVDQIRKLEKFLYNLEKTQNKLLEKISLEVHYIIIIGEKLENLFIVPNFIRSKKEEEGFDGLTTPEKVFYVMSFSICIDILLEKNPIVFSNLYIDEKFNKRGSIYRTIRKILPVFQEDEELSAFSLRFLISKLELKKKIKDIEIINIEEG